MGTILESLRGVNAYPVPQRTLDCIATVRGLELADNATQEAMRGRAYNLAVADLLMWLSLAPAVSQGGQSYDITDEQRQQMRNRAKALYAEFSDEGTATTSAIYGYKGDRL